MAKKRKKKSNQYHAEIEHNCNYEDPRVLTAMIRRTYQQFSQRYKEDTRFNERMDFDPAWLKRRIQATANYTPKVRELVCDICPTIDDYFYLEEEWAKINALNLTTYDTLEDQTSISMAAAIWVLDQVNEAGRLIELKRILPKDDGRIEEECMSRYPSIWDPCYDEELIWAVAYVLRNRNQDCAGIPMKKDSSLQNNAIMDAYTAAGKQHQDVPSRKQFEEMMALIPAEVRLRAEQHFEEKLWEITERFFRARSITVREQVENAKKLDDLHDRVNAYMETMMNEKMPRTSVNEVLPRTGFAPIGAASRLSQMMNNPLQYLEYSAGVEQQLDEQASAITERISRLLLAVSIMANQEVADFDGGIGKEAAKCLEGYVPGDPYEICFALFSLVDRDSDLPWLYFSGTAQMRNVCAALPWYDGDFCDYADPVWDAEPAEPEAAKKRKPSELPDFYALEYTDNRDDPSCRSYSNLAQIIYDLTGSLMPRNLHLYDSIMPELRHYGITGKKLQTPLLLCMGILGTAQRQVGCAHFDFSELERLLAECAAETDDTENDEAENADQVEMLQNEVAQLKTEIKRMKRGLYEAEKASREAQTEIAALQQKSKEEKQELADLREIVFRQENEIEEATETESDISLPYEVQARTVVFGGHDTWAKAIKPMLTGKIRFVDRAMQPNADLIRRASVVWLQSNSMSHHTYYAIMNIVRANNIPLRYFTFASAEKCALQLAEADRFSGENYGKQQ